MVFGIFKPPETGFSRFHINFPSFPSNQQIYGNFSDGIWSGQLS